MDINEGMAKASEMGAKVRYLGIFMVVLGALSIWNPQVADKALAIIVGIPLILGGIGGTLFSWIAPSWGL